MKRPRTHLKILKDLEKLNKLLREKKEELIKSIFTDFSQLQSINLTAQKENNDENDYIDFFISAINGIDCPINIQPHTLEDLESNFLESELKDFDQFLMVLGIKVDDLDTICNLILNNFSSDYFIDYEGSCTLERSSYLEIK